jgi:hypothetical protein
MRKLTVCRFIETSIYFWRIGIYPRLHLDSHDEKITMYKWSSWSWSYGSWIYNYMCNQCLSPLTLWVRTPFMAKCTQYNIMCTDCIDSYKSKYHMITTTTVAGRSGLSKCIYICILRRAQRKQATCRKSLTNFIT